MGLTQTKRILGVRGFVFYGDLSVCLCVCVCTCVGHPPTPGEDHHIDCQNLFWSAQTAEASENGTGVPSKADVCQTEEPPPLSVSRSGLRLSAFPPMLSTFEN